MSTEQSSSLTVSIPLPLAHDLHDVLVSNIIIASHDDQPTEHEQRCLDELQEAIAAALQEPMEAD